MDKNNRDTIYSFYTNSVYKEDNIKHIGIYTKTSDRKWILKRDCSNYEIGRFKRMYPMNKFMFGLFSDTFYYKKIGVWERMSNGKIYQIDYGKNSYMFQNPIDTIW